MTIFERQLKSYLYMIYASYKQLSERGVHPTQIAKFMKGERGLSGESIGKIIDYLGCHLSPPERRWLPKPVGRPKKAVVYDKKAE